LINSYDFGVMIINDKKYTSDVIIFPEKVIDKWWRKEGHKVCVEDLKEIIDHEPKPEVLIIGTGYYGCVEILPEVEKTLESYGIELIAEQTREAYKIFNRLLKSSRRVAGAFHLTC